MLKQISSASFVPMIGSTVVNTMSSLEDVQFLEHADVARALAAAETGDEESARLIGALMDSALKEPIEKILSFCGVNAELTGGTIGEPNTVSELAYVFQLVFQRLVLDGTNAYIDPSWPMWNADELRRRCLVAFLWRVVHYG